MGVIRINTDIKKCPICGMSGARVYHIDKDREKQVYVRKDSFEEVYCKQCGHWIISEYLENKNTLAELASYARYHKDENSTFYFGNKLSFSQEFTEDDFENLVLVNHDDVRNWYPRNFSQITDRALMYFQSNIKYFGEVKKYTYKELVAITFAELPDGGEIQQFNAAFSQIEYLLDFLEKQNYIEYGKVVNVYDGPEWQSEVTVKVLPKGLARVDELQKDISNNKDVFVAMSFHNTEDIREAIRRGILEAGFSDKFIDEIIHNQQIVPYMMRLIRECRFLIMDITDPNYGAYYEAGYALGLGKEVIITCSKEIFSKKDFANKLEEKALKPHFDIAQKQILVWEDTADLTKQLKEWILELSTRKR